MTEKQKERARKMIGKVPRDKIAKKLGVSVSNLKRSLSGESLWFKNGKYKNRPELVEAVLRYYEKHGKPATIKKFPKVNVKSIVDRPDYYGVKVKPRQLRWKDHELIEVAKMGGLVSMDAQAKYFNRPRAFGGSIQSVWAKRFNLTSGYLHGMPWYRAKHFVKPRCPSVKVEFCRQRRKTKNRIQEIERQVYLWVDMEKHLRDDCPEFLAKGIGAMAEFQRWLFESDNPQHKIKHMIARREKLK